MVGGHIIKVVRSVSALRRSQERTPIGIALPLRIPRNRSRKSGHGARGGTSGSHRHALAAWRRVRELSYTTFRARRVRVDLRSSKYSAQRALHVPLHRSVKNSVFYSFLPQRIKPPTPAARRDAANAGNSKLHMPPPTTALPPQPILTRRLTASDCDSPADLLHKHK